MAQRVAPGDEVPIPTEEASVDPTMDYWFDMTDQDDVKTLVTYANGGFEIDRRDNSADPEQTWADLIRLAADAIKTDIDQWGLPS
jgi:hypothetical protein